jgi:O-methyltransferase domain/Dimerisation domain
VGGVSGVDTRRPRVDDRPLWDVVFGVYGYPAPFIAHRLGLFPLLAERPRTFAEVCEELEVKRRPTEVILAATLALGFIKRNDGRYALTELAEDYLLETGLAYFGFYWDLNIDHAEVFSYANLERAIRTDSAQAYGGEELFASNEAQAELARGFTRGMHGLSMGPAHAWPEVIDLSDHHVMLDVGGGSGAHSIGAVARYPNLGAVVLDLPAVCEVAAEFIAHHGLQDRIRTHNGDMWVDPFPAADVHFYSNIFHDWPPEKCRLLTAKSFESLESGGRIVLHEILYHDDKSGPFAAVGLSMVMMGWTEGEQYSGAELSAMLTDAGFRDIEVRPTFGYYSIVTAGKP